MTNPEKLSETEEFRKQIVAAHSRTVDDEDWPMFDWLTKAYPYELAVQLTDGWPHAREYFLQLWEAHQLADKEAGSWTYVIDHDWDRRELILTVTDSENHQTKVRLTPKVARHLGIKILKESEELEDA